MNFLNIFLMSTGTYSIISVIHIILFIIALISIVGSQRSIGSKVLWAAIVFFFPIVGLIIYYLIGHKSL